MSLPIAHGCVGLAIYAIGARHIDFCSRRVAIASAALLPAIPDFDFALVWLFGMSRLHWHRTHSHSITFALVCGALYAGWIAWRGRSGAGRAFVFVFALIVSHAIIDMFGQGPHGFPGRGVMLLWPFDHRFYDMPWQFLPPGMRSSVAVVAKTAAIELAYTGPFAIAAWWWRFRFRRQ